MSRYFADSFYWIALLYRRDTWHRQVTAFSQTLTNDDTLFTTDAVLTEFLAAISAAAPHMRQRAADRVEEILGDPRHQVIDMTRGRFLEGLALYKSRLDKAYSLTDCFSMNVMRREGITEVLSNDRHFVQEGFRVLFP
jgi:predicted nucleic acid-binding protein